MVHCRCHCLCAAVTAAGSNVDVLLAGTAALAFMNDTVASAMIDVVFMDIMMPGLTGIQVVDKLACKPYHCPIIATTGSVDETSLRDMR